MNETAAAYGMGDWPLWAVLVGLFVVVMARSHLFYWLGRGVTGGATRIARAGHHDQVADHAPAAAPGTAPEMGAPDRSPSTGGARSDTGEARGSTAAARGGGAADHVTTVLPALPDPARTGAQARALRLLHSPAARRGLALVHRFGPFAVVLAYLTVGVQTAVFVGSGVLRMSYLRFSAASVPGSVAWACIWGTIGYTAFWAAVRLAGASPWALAGVLLVLAVAVTGAVLHRRTRRAAARADTPAAPTAPAEDELV